MGEILKIGTLAMRERVAAQRFKHAVCEIALSWEEADFGIFELLGVIHDFSLIFECEFHAYSGSVGIANYVMSMGRCGHSNSVRRQVNDLLSNGQI